MAYGGSRFCDSRFKGVQVGLGFNGFKVLGLRVFNPESVGA